MKELAAELSKYTNINDHAIGLEEVKPPPYWIYLQPRAGEAWNFKNLP